MQIHTITVTPFDQNARLIVDESTGVAAVVDPGGEVEQILKLIAKCGVTVDQVVLTHAHLDHAGGVKRLLESLEITQSLRPRLLAHRAESMLRAHLSQQAMMFGLSPQEYENCPEPDRYLDDGDRITIGSCVAEVRYTPGHSPGHIVLYFAENGVLLAGDTLFQGSIGRTDLPGGNHDQLIQSIKGKLYNLPQETVVMCGHGPNTTIEAEKRSNPFVRG